MVSTGIFVLDVGMKGTPKTCRERDVQKRDLFCAISDGDLDRVSVAMDS